KKQRRRDVGRILIGFSILMYGMELMKGAVSPLADMPEFSSMLTAFTNPLLGVAVGAVFTGVIQSSAASVGILQALALTGSITYGMAIPIIMGQNIGTCVTALISSIGVNRNAKQVAAIHISFNVIGTAVCLVLFYGGGLFIEMPFMDLPVGAMGIAGCHSIFNILTTALLLPFSRQLEKLAKKMVKDEDKTQEFAFLDPLLLRTPAVAIAECVSMTNRMGELARETLNLALEQLDHYTEARETAIAENEDKLDIYEDRLGRYLVKISQKGVSADNIRTVSRLLHSIGDFERIGDHAVNLQESARELHEKDLHFSEKANEELKVVFSALTKIVNRSFDAFINDDVDKARRVEVLEEAIDGLIEEMRSRHIIRLQTGECTIQLGFVLNDLLANLERVSDHCSNIAISVIQEKTHGFNPHVYTHDIKQETGFTTDLAKAQETFRLP
ncbi:MAG: Na/Pi cotransporter family protein, partial [Oscillospiraceae bacterium]|nr:Na/Pi cotransporter family protein [Oscillospiraceae bacterium]